MSSNIQRSTRRKRQTRLTFDAINPTASATSKMSPARVRYEGSGKQKVNSLSGRPAAHRSTDGTLSSSYKRTGSAGASPLKQVLTPESSSKNQGKAPGSSARSSKVEVVIRSSPLEASRGSQRTLRSTKNPSVRVPEFDTSDESEPAEPTPTKSQRRKSSSHRLVSDSEDEMFSRLLKQPTGDTPFSRASKKGKASAPRNQRVTSSNNSDNTIPLASPKVVTISNNSDDAASLPPPKVRTGMFGSTQPSSSKGRGNQTVTLDSDSESDDLVSSPKRSQQPFFKLKQRTVAEESDEDILSLRVTPTRKLAEFVDSDEDIISSPMKRRRAQVETDDDEDETIISPIKRLRKSKAKAKELSDDDSMEGEVSSKRFTRQQKVKRHRSEKEKTLELLKRKRAGENIDALTTSESESGDDDSEEDFQKLSEFEDDEEEEEEPVQSSRSAKNKRRSSVEGDVADDSDFIVEDDEAPLGVPDYAVSIPLEFTHASHKPLKEHFRDVVEWMVKNRIFPAFPRYGEVYNVAFSKLDDESTGLAISKFSSTQWTKDFTVALYARPHIIIGPLAVGEGVDALGQPKCDACNHRKHQPTFAISFAGKAYDKRTLVDLDQGSDDESSSAESNDSDDSDTRSCDANGRLIPPETTRWATGRFCKANAEFASTLIHWKYSLNEWVVDTLEREGYLSPAKLAERDKMKPKQLNRFADSLVDAWEASGTIKGLYRDYKAQMTTATELKSHGRGGWR